MRIVHECESHAILVKFRLFSLSRLSFFLTHRFAFLLDWFGAQVERRRREERHRPRRLCVAASVYAAQSAHCSQLAKSLGPV